MVVNPQGMAAGKNQHATNCGSGVAIGPRVLSRVKEKSPSMTVPPTRWSKSQTITDTADSAALRSLKLSRYSRTFAQLMILVREIGNVLDAESLQMDRQTLGAYDHDAAAFAKEWEAQPVPVDVYDLIGRYFDPGLTADIGCGSGRDTNWFSKNGYTAIGFDASEGLLAEARRLHPGIEFRYAALPELNGIADGVFNNVFCETVIMHLSADAIEPSVKRLVEILRLNGTLYLSWRVTEKEDKRDDRGRLYSAFDPTLAFRALASQKILFNDHLVSPSSGKTIQRMIVRKVGGPTRYVA
jgi:SAM-dependent methyltransferase